jgi:uncharacterized protein YeaO (DUF488 family)
MLKVKRIYEKPATDDGMRVLVDRLWPRGISRSKARIDAWLKDVAPSDALRKWFAHEPARWTEFKRRYFRELKGSEPALELIQRAVLGNLTLLYGARDEDHNNAVALGEFLKRRNRRRTTP